MVLETRFQDPAAPPRPWSVVHREVQKSGEATPQLLALSFDGKIRLSEQYAFPTVSPCFIHLHPCGPSFVCYGLEYFIH